MQKRLTITLDADTYTRLQKTVGRRHVSRFIGDLVRPHLADRKLEAGYKEMAQDKAREKEALEWSEATIGDIGNEPW